MANLVPYTDLQNNFSGQIYTDQLYLSIYATDASAYRMYPSAVAIPKNSNDIRLLLKFAHTHK
ncbi:MAG: FAD-binding oxidoreductase, partial [Lutibacter sp.]|nr:FAD-binding oxidoreductase [Lutibacter sp.]